ncbi:TMEM165/GDT1 family protein [Candidatus Poribacteria bacterium]|nr:TMEM165/GDT1 family protein [Candidatus Poribacteria bacterium]
MDWKIIMTTFWAIFIAELGDKTQLAAITMTSKTRLPVSVFLGAVLALATVTLIGVVFGDALIRIVPENIIKKAAAVVFIVIGILIFWGKM